MIIYDVGTSSKKNKMNTADMNSYIYDEEIGEDNIILFYPLYLPLERAENFAKHCTDLLKLQLAIIHL